VDAPQRKKHLWRRLASRHSATASFFASQGEEHAQVECDRLNAASGGSHVHYSVKPAHIRPALANDLHLLAEAFRRVFEWPRFIDLEISASRLSAWPYT
jgi:hypothetical protein